MVGMTSSSPGPLSVRIGTFDPLLLLLKNRNVALVGITGCGAGQMRYGGNSMSDRDDSQDEGVQDSQGEVVRDLYPKEFAQLAIGVPINADMNKVMLLTRAFDGGKLANSGLFVDPKPSTYGRLELRAGATDSKTQDTSGWNASASMKLNLGIADFSAKFYVQ